jgi:ubiquinone/menaquinone biosynthesis C-methylase UbiE
MEDEYVLQPYMQIADHFDKTRSGYRWGEIERYLKSLDTNAFLLDAGCGNGRNMSVKQEKQCIGFDFCASNNKICAEKGLEVSTVNIKRIPFRDNVFDHSFTVAVLHHIETETDRLLAINELVRVTRPGGTIYLQVWSADIPKNKKFIRINDQNDYFVTWHLRDGQQLKRYYHLFTRCEFASLLSQIKQVQIETIDEDTGNWLGILRKGVEV